MTSARSLTFSLLGVGCALTVFASAAQGDVPTDPAPSCAPAPADVTRLRRDSARLLRTRVPRTWLRAEPLLEQIDQVCGGAGDVLRACPSEAQQPGRAAAEACASASRQLWEALGVEDDIRAGRRELRRLSVEDQDNDYSYLVGQYEHRQVTALDAFPGRAQAFGQLMTALDEAQARVPEANRSVTAPGVESLRLAHRRLAELAARIAEERDLPPQSP